MAWESFLRKTADEFGLSREQTEVFLVRFNEENKQKSDGDIQKLFEDCYQLPLEAYKKRRTGLYNKFQWNIQNPNGCRELINAGSHKAKHLCKWLESRYADKALELESSVNSPKVNEANHLAERFSKAVQQLGSNNYYDRLSGIYGLEKVLEDAEDGYYWKVIEILTLHVRQRSPWNKEKEAQAESEQAIPPLPDDIQKVMTVLAQRKYAHGHHLEPRPLDLHNTDLRRLKLYPQAQLGRVNFSGSNLQNAILKKVNLQKANLEGANLQGADFEGANLQQAKLWKVNLEKAKLIETNLQQACLAEADLRGAFLFRANLRGAILLKAKLQKTQFKIPNPDFTARYGVWDVLELTWEQLDEAASYEGATLPEDLPPRQQQLQTGTA